jgi:hypothetical protein
VGSTRIVLSTRFAQHQSDMKRWQCGKRGWVSSFEILQHDNAQIELIHEEEFGDIKEMCQLERYWIDKLPTVNRKRKREPRKKRRNTPTLTTG